MLRTIHKNAIKCHTHTHTWQTHDKCCLSKKKSSLHKCDELWQPKQCKLTAFLLWAKYNHKQKFVDWLTGDRLSKDDMYQFRSKFGKHLGHNLENVSPIKIMKDYASILYQNTNSYHVIPKYIQHIYKINTK